MAWLGTWAKRVKVTIDSTDIDAALTDFPILVYVSASCGINSENVSFVFDELQNDNNRKKIAVTKSDGTTELYVEIEKWDDANEKAWLWVKVSGADSIASGADTDLYLYYDSTHADNDSYVGDTNDEVAENVWDANFIAVYHMRDGADNEHIYDSTLNDNDGTKVGAGAPAVTTGGKIDGAQEFDGDDDYIRRAETESLSITGDLTIEAWIEPDVVTGYHNIVIKQTAVSTELAYGLTTSPSDIYFWFRAGAAWHIHESTTNFLTQDNWWHVVAVQDDTNNLVKLYGNATEQYSAEELGSLADIANSHLRIGWREGELAGQEFDGIIDEVRISDKVRLPEWIKATYETSRDHLLDFGSEENIAWLGTWAKRVKLTIDNTDIDGALSNFPVLVYISTSSGRNSEDVSFVFDELTDNANRKKIAITTDDKVTECYVEIEKWDDANEEAWLWVKVPSIASGEDTDLYLYYDSGHAENGAYIGDPSDAVVHNVWDSNFKFVSHMRDDPDDEHIRDSTVNANDGTKVSAGVPAVTTSGKIGDAQVFDGTDDYIDCGTNSILGSASFTLEAFIKTDTVSKYTGAVVIGATGVGNSAYVGTVAAIQVGTENSIGGGFYGRNYGSGITTLAAFVHVVLTFSGGTGGTALLYTDGVEKTTDTQTPTLSSTYIRLGRLTSDTGYDFDGIADEVRISDIARTAAWLAATYETAIDHLLDWGSEEILAAPDHYDRSATALLGLLSTGERVIVLVRSDTSLLGLLSTGSRAMVYTAQSATALLGLLGIATREIGYSRADTALLGLLTTASRVIVLTRLDTALLGLKGIASRAIGYIPRVATALLGLLATATRTVTLTRTNTALLGLKTTGARVLSLIRIDTALLGLKTTYSKAFVSLKRRMSAIIKPFHKAPIPGGTGEIARAHTAWTKRWNVARAYVRSATALLGLLTTGTRTIALTRTETALLGLLTTASRFRGYTRADTALLGLKTTATRVLTLTRIDTALLGLKTTALRAIVYTAQSGTALLGLLTTAERAVSYSRTKTALLGLLTTATRVLTLIRLDTALLGLKTVGSKGRLYIESGIALLGLTTTASRTIVMSRTRTALLGLKTTATRVLTLTRIDSALLGLKTTASRFRGYARVGTALLGLKTTGVRVLTLTRGGTALLGFYSTGARLIHYIRTATALLGLKATGARTVAYTRVETALLGLKTTATRVIILTRADTALLGLLTTASRALAYIRADTTLLGLKTTAERAIAYARTEVALLGLLTTATRVVTLVRLDTALLGLLATGVRVITLTRADTALLGLKTTATRAIAYIRTKTALLGLKTTATRVLALTRTDTALLGLKSTAVRVISLIRTDTALLGLYTTATQRAWKLRHFVVTVFTTQYRSVRVATSQHRVVSVLTAQYRRIQVATSQHRFVKVATATYRKIKVLLTGG